VGSEVLAEVLSNDTVVEGLLHLVVEFVTINIGHKSFFIFKESRCYHKQRGWEFKIKNKIYLFVRPLIEV
jgi:hypothetical protein